MSETTTIVSSFAVGLPIRLVLRIGLLGVPSGEVGGIATASGVGCGSAGFDAGLVAEVAFCCKAGHS